jgi:hypothetical protein
MQDKLMENLAEQERKRERMLKLRGLLNDEEHDKMSPRKSNDAQTANKRVAFLQTNDISQTAANTTAAQSSPRRYPKTPPPTSLGSNSTVTPYRLPKLVQK